MSDGLESLRAKATQALEKQSREYIAAQDSGRQYHNLWYRGTIKAEDGEKPWVYVKVHEGLCSSAYHSLSSEGVDCVPIYDKPHISLIRKGEVAELKKKFGDKWKGAAMDGQPVKFRLQKIVSVVPNGWDKYDRVWFIEVESPRLRQLRSSLGFPELPESDDGDQSLRFHITFAGKPASHIKHAAIEALAAAATTPGPMTNPQISPVKRSSEPGKHILDVFNKIELDPEVTMATLGKPYTNAGVDTLLRTSQKLLNINQGSEEVDDRDSLAFQTFHSPEDFFAERINRDAGGVGRKMLWKATNRGNLRHIPVGVLTPQLRSVLLNSGMGSPLEEINPLDIYDQKTRITRLGEGGMSMEAVPEEARSVQPSHFGFIDPVKMPESEKMGIDARAAHRVMRGSDGQLYTPMKNMKTGVEEPVSATQASKSIVAFPGEMAKDTPKVRAMDRSKQVIYVDRNKVDYELQHPVQMFSATSNLVPLISGIKGGRLLMGAKYPIQSLALQNPEAPLVRSQAEDGKSFVHKYGTHVGALHAKQDGVVEAVSGNGIKMRYADGTTEDHELYNNMPFNRKSFIHNTPVVQVGQKVGKDQLLAHSNFTDKEGNLAIGTNLRTAYIPYRGLNYEDAVIISESASKRLTSEHMYQNQADKADNVTYGRKQFVSLYPAKFEKHQLANIDDTGVIKVGSKVRKGDPLVLGVKQNESSPIHKGHRPMFSDSTMTWDHDLDGVVTDVDQTKEGGYNVTVKAYANMKEGDKLCYSDDTQVLTLTGWKDVGTVNLEDSVASLTEDGRLEYIRPSRLVAQRYIGDMYTLDTTQVSLCVTPDHSLYAKRRYSDRHELLPAKELYGKTYRMQNNAAWKGADPEYVVLPAMEVKAGQSGNGTRIMPELRVPIKTYAMLLGMFLSEGNLVDHAESGSYGFDISQVKPHTVVRMHAALAEAGVRYTPTKSGIRVYSKQWLEHLRPFGKCYQKYIPNSAFLWSKETLEELYGWLMWGDGHVSKTLASYVTTSAQLADDFQRLCLHIGFAARIGVRPPTRGMIKGKEYDFRQRYDVYVYRSKNNPQINHGHSKHQNGQYERWTYYDGTVHCLTLPRNHTLYVRRNGKPVWSGNCGSYGDKGVVSRIIPDSQMPHDKDGKPVEVIANPLGLVSRINPSQIYEALLGKIARKTGKPLVIPGFMNQNLHEYTRKALNEAGLSDTEELTDPVTGRKIPQVLTGERFIMKLHHTAESKISGRDTGSYTSEGLPARGGAEGAKRVSNMEQNSLISHGATEVLRDAQVVRGQRNDEYWKAFRLGYTPPPPKVPLVYDKFIASLKGAGVNVNKNGHKLHLFALNDKDVEQMSAGEVLSGNTVTGDKLDPVKGGLFDESVTGGHGGNRWSHIKLSEPLPNPVMEDPIRRLLGLTGKQYEEVLSGKRKINGESGGEAIRNALQKINLDTEIQHRESTITDGPKSKRDAAVKSLGYLKSLKDNNLRPEDWVMTKWPVMPPALRPITNFKKMQLIADPNYLYRDMMQANRDLGELKDTLGKDNAGDERLQVYNAMKAVAGLGDPIQAKTQEKNTKGLLQSVFGSSPKLGQFQRRVLGSPVDVVGRSVITPNPDLNMDQVGLPEASAWTIYRPFVVRNLIRRGMPAVEAAKAVAGQSKIAREALQDETTKRPLLINRAPTLHRYGFMAAWPVLHKGDTLQLSPVVTSGYGADFDGDAMNFHVPVTDEAVKDATDKMLPSKNLHSVRDFQVHYLPRHEFVMGLYLASTAKNKEKQPRVFRSQADVVNAFHRGELHVGDPVSVKADSK